VPGFDGPFSDAFGLKVGPLVVRDEEQFIDGPWYFQFNTIPELGLCRKQGTAMEQKREYGRARKSASKRSFYKVDFSGALFREALVGVERRIRLPIRRGEKLGRAGPQQDAMQQPDEVFSRRHPRVGYSLRKFR